MKCLGITCSPPADVCGVLGLDASLAVNGRQRGELYSGGLDNDEKGTAFVSTPGGLQEMLIVSEPGLESKAAKIFKPSSEKRQRKVAISKMKQEDQL